MNIREIEHDELDSLLDLYTHYVVPESRPPLSREKIERIWAQLKANPGVHYFVLEIEDKLIASCILSITPSFIRGGDAFGIIEHVVTHSDHRRVGHAETLIRRVLEFAWSQGCTEVMLLSGSANLNAHAMYEKIGFDKKRKTGFVIWRP